MKSIGTLVGTLTETQGDEAALGAIARWLKEVAECDACDILLPAQGGALAVRASTRHPEMAGRVRLGRGVGLVGLAFSSGETLHIPDGLAENETNRALPGLEEPESRSAVAVPMPNGNEPLGVVYFRRAKAWKLTKAKLREIEHLVEQVTLVWRGFRSGYASGTQSNRFGVISEVTKTLTDSPYLEEILQLLVNITARRFNYRVVTVRLLDEGRQELILRATQATNKAYQRKPAIKLGESIAGRAIALGSPVIVEDVQTSEEYIGHDLAEEQGLHSMVCVPLIVANKPVGVMSCYTGEIRQFPEDEIAILETLAKQAAVSIEHAKLHVRHTLMQEMHHRVKNNLQQVASLLRLQLRQSHYKSLEDALEDSLSRIQAIAAVHELLSRDDLDHVSIRHIAEMLGHHQQQSFVLPGKRIAFSVRGDEVHLNTNQATQVALVINEMIQNAVEHGFQQADEGEVHITVENRDGVIGLWVSNDGDPLPPGFDAENSGQLGLQIIRSLAKALGGQFKIESRLGWTVCELKFSRHGAE